MEVRMVLIKVQYGAYNRQFKLLDREVRHALSDGETYMLIADVSLEDRQPAAARWRQLKPIWQAGGSGSSYHETARCLE
jgi:hypothetical protein